MLPFIYPILPIFFSSNEFYILHFYWICCALLYLFHHIFFVHLFCFYFCVLLKQSKVYWPSCHVFWHYKKLILPLLTTFKPVCTKICHFLVHVSFNLNLLLMLYCVLAIFLTPSFLLIFLCFFAPLFYPCSYQCFSSLFILLHDVALFWIPLHFFA